MEGILHSNALSELDSVLKLLLRRFDNLTGSELAKRIGIPISTINRLLAGTVTDPRISTLKPIANYFGITVDQLLGFSALPEKFIEANVSPDPSKVIPLLTFDNFINGNLPQKWFTWVTQKINSNNSFAICLNNDEFEPIFEKDTILIIETEMLPPKHLDYILIEFKNEKKLSIKRYFIEGNEEFLLPINKQLKAITKNEKKHKIIGVITEAHTKLRNI